MMTSTDRHSVDLTLSEIVTNLRVGIWEHELVPQLIRVRLRMTIDSPAIVENDATQFDSNTISDWICRIWPQYPHTPLLETRMRELLQFVFQSDARITALDATLLKPTAFDQVGGVGVRMTLKRHDHVGYFGDVLDVI